MPITGAEKRSSQRLSSELSEGTPPFKYQVSFIHERINQSKSSPSCYCVLKRKLRPGEGK